jgi:CRP-like cAMP-binding protein
MNTLLDLVKDAPELEFAAGDTLILQGNPLSDLYILKEGEVEVLRNNFPVCKIKSPGSCFGELSALLGTESIATVVATEPTTMVVLKDAASFLAGNHAATLEVARLLAHRVRWMTSRGFDDDDDLDENYLFWRSRV